MTVSFLLGAGFNADANTLVGPYRARSLYGEAYDIRQPYPLISELGAIAFPGEAIVSFEERLASAITAGDHTPVARMVDALMRADHYTGARLHESDAANIYDRFFDWCGPTSFLTFNYDAFVELRLFRAKRWYPHDGFGLPVQVTTMPGVTDVSNWRSTHRVLHLHGSYLLYSVDFALSPPDSGNVRWISRRARPEFLFDPDALGTHFFPFERVPPSYGYRHPDRRIIAPVPDKTSGLGEDFVRECYDLARAQVTDSDRLFAIGYSFAECDRRSFEPILDALSGGRHRSVTIIDPDAENIVGRLRAAYSGEYQPIPWRFRDWARLGFPESAVDRS